MQNRYEKKVLPVLMVDKSKKSSKLLSMIFCELIQDNYWVRLIQLLKILRVGFEKQ